jgi:dihydrofolate synthase/folylpolyglutamate synthase
MPPTRSKASRLAETVSYLEGLSPWPEHFGLERIRALLASLGDPQRRFPSIHVVGSNGKTSTTLMTAALLQDAGLRVGATISPHIRSWSERIQVDGTEADLTAALARVRPYAAGATQFELLITAALAEFAASRVEVAVVEAGLGGRLDATNVLGARLVVLTNISLEHTEVLGASREAIATEKLAVVTPGASVVLGEAEWAEAAWKAGAGRVATPGDSNLALAVETAEQFLGAEVDPSTARQIRIPGRLEQRSERPLELWDGAHNPAGIAYLLAHLPARRYVIVAAILADKDANSMLEALAGVGDWMIATASASPRALPAEALALRALPFFEHVEALASPPEALVRARALAGPEGAVLVTGSLYLLSELSRDA